jgi:hypothetical protein
MITESPIRKSSGWMNAPAKIATRTMTIPMISIFGSRRTRSPYYVEPGEGLRPLDSLALHPLPRLDLATVGRNRIIEVIGSR